MKYSLAALCYELFSGRRRSGCSRRRRKVEFATDGRALDAVILRGLAEEPKNRFKNVGEFVAAFDQALATAPARRQIAAHGTCSA